MPITLHDAVPAFQASATSGVTVTEQDLLGRYTVLYFYPKDSTPGCTTESQEFSAQYAAFQEANCQIFGVSRDSLKSHESFKAAQSMPFELISDPDETLCELFGVMQLKNMYGKQVRGVERSTFLMDPNGVVIQEWRKVKVPGHVAAVLDALHAAV
jgi:peroxiredoxin Q/BCP